MLSLDLKIQQVENLERAIFAIFHGPCRSMADVVKATEEEAEILLRMGFVCAAHLFPTC